MRIGLSYDLKEAVCPGQDDAEDALEEYDSPETVEAIAAVFKAHDHEIVRLGGGREFLSNILHAKVDMVFNIAEGLGHHRSREAQVPSVLEMLGIPYSGSDPQCLAICLDKLLTKSLVRSSGIRTPKWQVLGSEQEREEVSWTSFPFPAFVKPAYEGSSKGIRGSSRVENLGQLTEIVERLLRHYRQPVMVEEFVAGDDVTVGIVGNKPPRIVGVMRVIPKKTDNYFIYSLEVKRDWERLVDYECPARISEDAMRDIVSSSLHIFQILGCRDLARLDFRLSPEGIPSFLEINPLPGLNPRSSDLPIMANRMGMCYEDLLLAVLNSAMERYGQCVRR